MAAVRAFSFRGIRVLIDQSWFIAFFLFAWTLSAGYFPMQVPNYPAIIYWLFGTLCSLSLFACVLAHELSHCLAARRLGVEARQVTLFIFGGVSEMSHADSSNPKIEFQIAIAGPLASIGLGVIFVSLAFLMRESADRIIVETFHYLYYVNFLLAAFNLLPAFPLDGGRVLRSYLWSRSGRLTEATRSAARVGNAFATVLMAFGVISLIRMHIIPGLWLFLIGLFLKKSAEREYRSFELQFGLQDLRLREIMTPPVAVDTSTTISEFVNNYVFHYHNRVFPAMENGRFAGMIDIRSIRHVPLSDWPHTAIGGYLSDPSTYFLLDPNLPATDALRLMTDKCTEAPIVQDGVLLGMLTRSDLSKLVSLKSDLAA